MTNVQKWDEQLAGMIDHTLLKPDATADQVIQLCEEAKQYRFATVCINPYWVALAAKHLEGSEVGVTTVVGFPLGATTSGAKATESREAIQHGATEIDMVMNVGALKSGREEEVRLDIQTVVEATGDVPVKVILETGLLSDNEKVAACKMAKEAGAAFVKTSTGFGPGGATAADIRLMRETVGPDIGVKASGGVRDADTARQMVDAGATRIGASAGIAIVTGGQGKSSY